MKRLRSFVVAVSLSAVALAVATPGCAERPGTKKDDDKDKKKDEKKDEKTEEKKE